MKKHIAILLLFPFLLPALVFSQSNIYESGDRVGIGTSNPQAKLDVNGQLVGGFGAHSTNGVLDWNDVSNTRAGNGYTLLLGNHANGPTGSHVYFHALNFEYATKSGSGNVTQFAIPYGYETGINGGLHMRGRYEGTWSDWVRILAENTNGNVAIGTGNPHFGDVSYGGASPILHVHNSGVAGAFRPIARFQAGPDADNTGASIIINHANDRGLILEAGRGTSNEALAHFGLVDNVGNVQRFLTARQGGNVGIGTTTPSNKLDVNGTIRAKEVIVESNWSDYVFEDDYSLRSLREVEAHITQHGHLPGVPSATEIATTGVSIGDSQRMLLEKVEELTLYAIEESKRNDRLESENAELRLRLERIEQAMEIDNLIDVGSAETLSR